MKAHALLVAIVTGGAMGTGCQVDNPPRHDLSVHPADLAVLPDMSLGIIVTTIAGNGMAGFFDGTGGSTGTAEFNYPSGVAVDGASNLFIADPINNRIRKIDRSGNVTTFAGNGMADFADGPGATAEFRAPRGVAVDGAGNLFVVDQGNGRIRKIDRSGNVTTVAGHGSQGFADGPGATAQFNFPAGVAVDGAGNLFVADQSNDRIRKIDLLGNVTTFAGSGGPGFGDGPGATAQFLAPRGVAVDGAGNVFVADTGNHRIRKIDRSGNVTTFAGNGTAGFLDGPGAAAEFNQPSGVAADGAGNVFVADTGNNRVREVDPAGQVTTIAGNGMGIVSDGGIGGFEDGTGGPKGTAEFSAPLGVIVDGAGHLFIADTGNNRIRQISGVPQ